MPRLDRQTMELTRRDVLRASGMAGVGLMVGGGAMPARGEKSLILLLLVGGPSQLDSFDPKPNAPSTVRGPFRSISTCVPGIRVCEHLPLLANRLDRVALVRSLSHDTAPMHEVGLQLLQTGRVVLPGETVTPVGAMISDRPIILPEPAEAPLLPVDVRSRYGRSTFGDRCARAFELVQSGNRAIVVNMYDNVFSRPTWDAHARGPFSTLNDYADSVLPTFDAAYNALLNDLERTGLLETTLVVAAGEFGRSPRLNSQGGRDHWTACGTALLAGCGVQGGRTIGESDAIAAAPRDRPVSPADLAATMVEVVGGDSHSLCEAGRPIAEAFA
jgi:hypothetical protein